MGLFQPNSVELGEEILAPDASQISFSLWSREEKFSSSSSRKKVVSFANYTLTKFVLFGKVMSFTLGEREDSLNKKNMASEAIPRRVEARG